jgi:Ser/Thr protein kinase RdoA (MazF antagonist)
MFSHRQRVARMRHVAVRALDAYPLVDRELRFISDDENTTFRVDATGPDGRDRFLLRVHRPARHGRNIDSAAAIGSELAWLTALRAGTDLLVPVPLPTTDGKLTTVAASPHVPEPRVCSVLRWMDGRIHSAAPRPVHLHRLGGVMAAAQSRWPVARTARFRADPVGLGDVLRRHDGLRGNQRGRCVGPPSR